jgi:hypothetical protein
VTLFPEPLSPTRARLRPASISSESPFTARQAFSSRPNSTYKFRISSSGIGLRRDSTDRSFEPYSRVIYFISKKCEPFFVIQANCQARIPEALLEEIAV